MHSHKIHLRYPQGMLQSLFTVDAYNEQDSMKVKCMPNSYPNAVKAIDALYKNFSQMYVDSQKEGTMNLFVCDFLQDSCGRFLFLKIHDFDFDMKPTSDLEWKLSTKFVDRVKIKEEKMIADQKCEAKLICENATSRTMLERACKRLEFWNHSNRLFKKVPQKLLIKYNKELLLGKQVISLNSDNLFAISPFYPLCAFPERDEERWKNFEKRMIRAETAFQTIGEKS